MTPQQLETLYFEMNVNRMLMANLYQRLGVPAEDFEAHVNKARDYVKELQALKSPTNWRASNEA